MISYLRWLTTANKILHFYVACNKPSAILKKFEDYIMNGTIQ